MAVTTSSSSMHTRNLALSATAMLAVITAVLLLLSNAGGAGALLRAIGQSSGDDLSSILIRYGLLPRFVIAVTAGLALGLSGALFQQVLRNPLAEPGTLAIFSGAKAALFAVVLWFPQALIWGEEPAILFGGLLALAFVLYLAARSRFQPLSTILIGMMLALCLEAFCNAAFLVRFEQLSDLLSWQTGSLVQTNWNKVMILIPVLILGTCAALLLVRPVSALEIGTESARSAGVPVFTIRLLGLSTAAMLSAAVAATAGPIGFIGLAGPAIAGRLGARTFSQRAALGAVMAAALLTIVDQGVLRLTGGLDIPAGAVTALLGAPVLIWLVRKAGSLENARPPKDVFTRITVSANRGNSWFALALPGLCIVCALAMTLGRLPDGWHLASLGQLVAVAPWRIPRIAAAGAGGAIFAIAGCLLQRLTGNPLASPEILGLSSGGALLLLLAVLIVPGLERDTMILLCGLGAFAVLTILIWSGRRSGFSSERMLLAGIALGALTGALTSLLVLFGDIGVQRLLGWMAGSTYSIGTRDATIALVVAAISLAVIPLLTRWLTLLPLGPDQARALGLGVEKTRLVLMLIIAAMTGAATLLVGPLSFAGLVAPHIARTAGLNRPLPQVYGAAAIGATCMILADWLGRTVAFPWQIPAGTVATLLGSLYFLAIVVTHDRRI